MSGYIGYLKKNTKTGLLAALAVVTVVVNNFFLYPVLGELLIDGGITPIALIVVNIIMTILALVLVLSFFYSLNEREEKKLTVLGKLLGYALILLVFVIVISVLIGFLGVLLYNLTKNTISVDSVKDILDLTTRILWGLLFPVQIWGLFYVAMGAGFKESLRTISKVYLKLLLITILIFFIGVLFSLLGDGTLILILRSIIAIIGSFLFLMYVAYQAKKQLRGKAGRVNEDK